MADIVNEFNVFMRCKQCGADFTDPLKAGAHVCSEFAELGTSPNTARDAIFLDHIEAIADSPSTDSKTKIRCINDMIKRWRSGKQHPVA